MMPTTGFALQIRATLTVNSSRLDLYRCLADAQVELKPY
jgi:hypothetical protein